MGDSRISVVICTRNRPDKIADCLQSLSKSNLLPREVVVVDQSDTQETGRVMKSIESTYPVALNYVRLTSVGHTKARNAGVKVCRGEIIAFTDDDCRVDRHWLIALQQEFDINDAQCVCGQTRPADGCSRKRYALLSTLRRKRRKLMKNSIYAMVAGKGNNMALAKQTILDLGSFNEAIGVGTSISAADDTDLFYRIFESGGNIVYTPHAVVYHAQPPDMQTVIVKKREYALSAAAVTVSRIRYGNCCAMGLLITKLLYEICYLFLGGLLRMNKDAVSIGWNSIVGTLSGAKYLFDADFCDNTHQLTLAAKESEPLSINIVKLNTP